MLHKRPTRLMVAQALGNQDFIKEGKSGADMDCLHGGGVGQD